MYICEKLDNSNITSFRKLNNLRDDFNKLNEDFFKNYDNAHFLNKFILRKHVKLLKIKSNFIGYIWITPKKPLYFTINAMNFTCKNDIDEACIFLISRLKNDSTFIYTCEKNDFNFRLLQSAGFKSVESTLKLTLPLNQFNKFVIDNNVDFEILKRGSQEEIRCKIQNEVFQNINRLPLTIDDIYEDEVQNYYIDKGAIFIKKDNIYFGYGQIIIENDYPTIVNLGILNKYRSNNYGKHLLKYLINIAIDDGYDKVNIKVDSGNNIALNLYTSLGFVIENETCKLEYKMSK